MPGLAELTLKVLVALLLGGALGFERERRGRPAGLRTHILVCLASTLLMGISGGFALVFGENSAASALRVDPGRIAAGIVTGIGFIGAGTIIQIHDRTHGLTTAASIWFVAALGIVIGSGFYGIAFVSTLIAFAVLFALHVAESYLPRDRYYKLAIRGDENCLEIQKVQEVLRGQGFSVTATHVMSDGACGETQIRMDLRRSRSVELGELLRSLHEAVGHPCCISLDQ